jgi:hypothetical protein
MVRGTVEEADEMTPLAQIGKFNKAIDDLVGVCEDIVEATKSMRGREPKGGQIEIIEERTKSLRRLGIARLFRIWFSD